MSQGFKFLFEKNVSNDSYDLSKISVESGYTSEIEEIVIPSEYNGLPVTIIGTGESIFQDYAPKIKKLIIPSIIRLIRHNAFMGANINSIIFEPNSSITTIGADAFANTKISEMSINSKSELIIGVKAFCLSEITKIDFSDCKLVSIKEKAFASSSLSEIKVPPTLKFLGCAAFKESNIKDISFLKDLPLLESLPKECFQHCDITDIPEWVFEKYFLDDSCFENNDIETLTVPSCAHMGERVFQQSLCLTTVNYYANSIPPSCFEECPYLYNVTLNNVKQINENAFYRCAIKKINFPSTVEKIGFQAFSCNEISELDLYETSISILGHESFAYNPLVKVILPFFLLEMGCMVFHGAPKDLDIVKNCPFVNETAIY